MGHIRLGRLPKTRAWKQVVEAIASGEDAPEIAACSAEAAERAFRGAAGDPVLSRSFWLLVQVPLAARGHSFVGDLARLGVAVPADPDLHDILGGISASLEDHARRSSHPNDLDSMARLSAIESLTALVGVELPSLFAPNPADVQRTIAGFSRGDDFSRLAREFLVRLTQRTLGYFLSRELAGHIGPDRRFSNDAERRACLTSALMGQFRVI